VYLLVLEGKSNQEIAYQLQLNIEIVPVSSEWLLSRERKPLLQEHVLRKFWFHPEPRFVSR